MKKVILTISLFATFTFAGAQSEINISTDAEKIKDLNYGSEILADLNSPKDNEFSKTEKPVLVSSKKNVLADNLAQPDEIHYGMNSVFNSIWILNQNTYGHYLINGRYRELDYRYSFGFAYGINGGYDFRRKHGVEFGLIINSRQGQKYHDEFSTCTVDREVKLKYLHIPILYKYKLVLNQKKITEKKETLPAIINIVAGFKTGILKFAEETSDSLGKDGTRIVTITDIKDRIHKGEFSLVFNLEYNYYINKFLYATFGLNSSISNNINTKEWPAIDHTGKNHKGRSHNFLGGVSIGINYYFTPEKDTSPKVLPKLK